LNEPSSERRGKKPVEFGLDKSHSPGLAPARPKERVSLHQVLAQESGIAILPMAALFVSVVLILYALIFRKFLLAFKSCAIGTTEKIVDSLG
jgi:hypothetical protein